MDLEKFKEDMRIININRLSEMIGMSKNHLHRLLRGHYQIKIATAAYIDKATNSILKFDDLMCLKDEIEKREKQEKEDEKRRVK